MVNRRAHIFRARRIESRQRSILWIRPQQLAPRYRCRGKGPRLHQPEEGVWDLRVELRSQRLILRVELVENNADRQPGALVSRIRDFEDHVALQLTLDADVPLLGIDIVLARAVLDLQTLAEQQNVRLRLRRDKHAGRERIS